MPSLAIDREHQSCDPSIGTIALNTTFFWQLTKHSPCIFQKDVLLIPPDFGENNPPVKLSLWIPALSTTHGTSNFFHPSPQQRVEILKDKAGVNKAASTQVFL